MKTFRCDLSLRGFIYCLTAYFMFLFCLCNWLYVCCGSTLIKKNWIELNSLFCFVYVVKHVNE